MTVSAARSTTITPSIPGCLAGGSWPLIPDSIDGTDEVEFLTSAEAFRVDERPDRLVIGGEYIAAEMEHFFPAR